MKKTNRLILVLVSILLMSVCVSCGKRSGQQEGAVFDNTEIKKTGEAIPYVNIYDLPTYKKRGDNYRKPIGDAIKSFDDDLEYVKSKAGTKILINENTHIEPLQGFDSLDIYNYDYTEQTVGDAKKLIREWMKINNLPEAPDSDIHFWSDNNVGDITRLSEDDSMEKAGYFIDCHRADYAICASSAGIYYASNGVVNKYILDHLSEEEKEGLEHPEWLRPVEEALGYQNLKCTEELVESGYYEELKDKEYELLDGMCSVEEAAKIAEDYFNTGVIYQTPDYIRFKVWWVDVYTLRDKYVYAMQLQAIINDVPTVVGLLESYGECYPEGMVMEPLTSRGCIVPYKNGVSTIDGTFSEGLTLTSHKNYDEMIGLREAVDILDEKLADRYKIRASRISFGYCEVIFNYKLENERCHFPCWEFRGEAILGEAGIHLNYLLYVDAISGDVIWHEYEPKNHR